jgi:hypothetical protein
MDLRCPKCKSTDLKSVSLAYVEGFYQSDKRAQFRGVLVVSGGPGVLASTSTTKGTKQTGLTAQSGGGGDMSNLQAYFSAACCPPRHSSFKSPVTTIAPKSLLVARQQNRVADRTFRALS